MTAPTASRDLVLPSSADPVVAGVVEGVGGPPGRHADVGRRRFWTPVRVVLLLVLLTCFGGYLQKLPCIAVPQVDNRQYTHACYTDVLPLYTIENLASGQLPYVEHLTLEYPVLIGGVMQLAATAVEPLAEGQRPRAFVEVTILLMTLGAVATAVGLVRLAGRRPWDAALFAVAPGLLLTAFINWDLAAVGLTTLAMLAWARRHPVLAGVLFGLGTATKLYPAILLGPLVLLAVRAGKVKEVAATVGAAAAAWLAVNVPVYLASPEGWSHFYDFSQNRGADWGSVWYVLQVLRGPLDEGLAPGEDPHLLNRAGVLVMLAGCVGVAALVAFARRRPRVPQVMFLVLLAFVISNKVWSPQFVLWLLPLAVLALPRWRPVLAWQAAEVVAFFAIWYYLIGIGTPGQGIGNTTYFTAILLRDVVVLALAAIVVRDVLRPEKDVVRQAGMDDPAGGVLDGAPDRPLGPLWRQSAAGAAGPGPGESDPGTAGPGSGGPGPGGPGAGGPGGPGAREPRPVGA